MRGTCVAKPALCSAAACYSDADCANAPSGTECYAEDDLNGVAGQCRSPVAAGSCLTDENCPLYWACQGGDLACDTACSCSDPTLDTVGQCKPATNVQSLWLRNASDLSWTSQMEVYWIDGNAPTSPSYLACPSYDVLRYDPSVGWQKIGEEPCAPGARGVTHEVVPEVFTALNPFDLSPHMRAEPGLLRLRGHFYRGCTPGADISTCSDGPFEHFSATGDVEVR